MSAAHSWYPRSNAWPSAEKSPDSDSDAPIVIGDLLAPLELEPLLLVELLLLLEPPHAASNTVTAATAAVLLQALRVDLVIWTLLPALIASTCRRRTSTQTLCNSSAQFGEAELQTFAAIVCDVIVVALGCQGTACLDRFATARASRTALGRRG